MTLVVNLAEGATPDVEIFVVPASTASKQPSPSLSNSKLLGMPSLSKSDDAHTNSLKCISVAHPPPEAALIPKTL